MSGLPRYGKIIAGLTAAFVLFTGGWFLANQWSGRPYQVVTQSPGTGGETAQSQAAAEPAGEERPDSLMEGETININTASVLELQRLPGIGEARAQAIVDWREQEGAFTAPEDLTLVPGIGEGILAQCRDYITVEG